MTVLTPTNAWCIFIDGTDRTDFVEAGSIQVRTRAHAQTGTMVAEVLDEAATLPIATDQTVILFGRLASGGATSLAAASSASATNIKVTAITGFAAGDEIIVGDHPTAEFRTISTVGTAGAGGTGITVSPALSLAHSSGHQVYEAERLFAGTVRRKEGKSHGSARIHKITARDYTDLLGQDVIDVAFRSAAESDKARVTWLVTTWGFKGVTAGAEVVQTLAAMPPGEDGNPEQDFSGKSLQRALEQIEKITGAEHYVDFTKRLHYFTTESNAAPFTLSTSPNGTTSWGYFDFTLPEDSVEKINAVYVYGAQIDTGQVRGWRPDPPPAAATRVAVVIRDTDVTSMSELAAVGDAYLADHSANMRDGSLKTYRSGFRAGQTVQITNPHWGLSATSFYIQEVSLEIENGLPLYTIDFGDKPSSMSGTVGGAVKASDEAIRVANDAVPAAVAAVSDLSAAGANMVTNSSFESSDFAGWTIGSGWVFGYLPVAPQVAFAGTRTARLDPAGVAAGELVGPLVSIDRLDDWWVSYWSFLRSRSSGSVQAKVRQFNAAGADLAADLTMASPGSTVETVWTRHSLHLGPNTEFGRTPFHASCTAIRLILDDASTGTFAWDVDGLQVERGRLITAYAPAPYELLDGSVSSSHIQGEAITSTHIEPLSITTPLLAASAVATDKLAANAVTAGKIAAFQITSTHINAEGISADLIRSGQLILGGVVGTGDRIDYLIVYDEDGEEIGRWGNEGLYIVDEANPLNKIRLVGGELQFADEEDASGNPQWRTAINAQGITADAIRLGTFPGGSNRLHNSGFEMAEFATPLTRAWPAQQPWTTTIGTDVNMNKGGASLTLTTVTY